MNYKAKGKILKIDDIRITASGVMVQQLHVEQEGSRDVFYPSALGDKIELLEDFYAGDTVEIEFHINGSLKGYNNVIIDNIKMA